VRPLRRHFPRLAAYITLAAPALALGAKAVEEATDTQIGGSAPVVDVLGVAIAVPVVLVGGTAGLAAQLATIVNEYDSRPFAHGQRSPSRDGRSTFTPAKVGLEHRYPAVAAAVNASSVDMAEIAAQLRAQAGSERSPDDWTGWFTSWAVRQGCLAARPRGWLPVLRTQMSRHCSAFGRLAERDPAETV